MKKLKAVTQTTSLKFVVLLGVVSLFAT